MVKLGLGIDLKDFDLDRVGFSISVLDEGGKKRTSEGYLRMTLGELDIFVRALKAAKGEIQLGTSEPDGMRRFMAGASAFGQRETHIAGGAGPREDEVLPKLALRPKALDPAEAVE